MEKRLKNIQMFEQHSSELNISEIKQRFIDLVEDRISDLEREMSFTKQGHDFYNRTQDKIDELIDLLSDMRNLI